MRFVEPEAPSPAARWTSRIAFFCLGIVGAGIFLHRLFGMPTPVALNLFAVAFAGALLAIVLGIIAAVRIWNRGEPGTARVLSAFGVAVGILGWPLAYAPVARALPEINDLTTDAQSPPQFVTLARQRGPGSNSADYPGAASFAAQAAAYPDLKPLLIERSSEETFSVVADAVHRQKMAIVREDAPDPSTGRSGQIEALDRTLIVGFVDDVAIRVVGDWERSQVDIRSASRYGRHDFGRNALRIRALMKEIVARLEVTVPTAGGDRTARDRRPGKGTLKRPRERDPKSEARRKSQDRVQSGAQRGPEQTGQPRARDDRRGRDRRPGPGFE